MRSIEKGMDVAGGCEQQLRFGGMVAVLYGTWGALIACALFFGIPNWQISQVGMRTSGTVVENRELQDSEGRSYTPIVEFQADGRAIRFEGQNSSDPPAYRVGQRVEVIYDPAQPERARIYRFSELWLAPLLLTLVAVVGGLLSTLWLLRRLWRRDFAVGE